MMKNYKHKILFIVGILILSNVFPLKQLIKLLADERHYRYSNFDGSHTTVEFKSRGFGMMKKMHQSCLSYHPYQKDKQLYRLFPKNPLAFWRWKDYFFDERYRLPYKNWNAIRKVRGKVKEATGCSLEF
jgi:hypothetical protein